MPLLFRRTNNNTKTTPQKQKPRPSIVNDRASSSSSSSSSSSTPVSSRSPSSPFASSSSPSSSSPSSFFDHNHNYNDDEVSILFLQHQQHDADDEGKEKKMKRRRRLMPLPPILLLMVGCCCFLSYWNITTTTNNHLLMSLLSSTTTSSTQQKNIQQVSQQQVPLPSSVQTAVQHDENDDNENDDNPILDVTQKHIDKIVKQYQNAVATKIELQASSWFRHVGPKVPKEPIMAFEENTRTSSSVSDNKKKKGRTAAADHHESQQKKLIQQQPLPGSTTTSTTTSTSASDSDSEDDETTTNTTTTIIWDNEENDISNYFDTLLEGCALHPFDRSSTTTTTTSTGNNKNHDHNNNRFDAQCFEYLQDLIHTPRCTTRMDSRYVCNGNSGVSGNDNESSGSAPAPSIPIENILGPTHLSQDTINIVILGAGPVGLYLANTLTGMQMQQQGGSTKTNKMPAIRIVIFENRLIKKGHKRPYSRDWITAIGYFIKGFDNMTSLDIRIRKLLSLLFPPNTNTALPINAWETLLLLSNKQRGVKFVYDDIADYHSKYLSKVPNLLMFDATGHRLNQLNRGNGDGSSGENAQNGDVTIRNHKSSSPLMESIVQQYWHNPSFDELANEGNPLIVASKQLDLGSNAEVFGGSSSGLEKKVSVASSKKSSTGSTSSSSSPSSLLYPVLDNNGTAYDIHMVKILNLPFDRDFMNGIQQIATRYNAPPDKFWIGPHFYWNIDGFFKSAIQHRLRTKYQGFSTRTHFITLTPEQGMALSKLVQKYSGSSASGEIPLSKIPVREFESNPLWDINGVGSIFLLVLQYHLQTLGKWGVNGPTISPFKLIPYMYTNPLVPEGYDFGDGKHAPLLRIGDSLSTGDPNCGSGLEMHMQVIRLLECRILNLNPADHPNCDIRIPTSTTQEKKRWTSHHHRRRRLNEWEEWEMK